MEWAREGKGRAAAASRLSSPRQEGSAGWPVVPAGVEVALGGSPERDLQILGWRPQRDPPIPLALPRRESPDCGLPEPTLTVPRRATRLSARDYPPYTAGHKENIRLDSGPGRQIAP